MSRRYPSNRGRPSAPNLSTASSSWRGPVKDRFPSPLVNTSDPRRRLAVLIDARNTHVLRPFEGDSEGQPSPVSSDSSLLPYPPPPLSPTVLQAIQEVGVPVLFRVFSHRFQLPRVWEPFCQPWHRFMRPNPSNSGSDDILSPATTTGGRTSALTNTEEQSSTSSSLYSYFQLFTVEPFVPVAMQMEADGDHLFRFKEENGIEGVCYVVPQVDRDLWIDRVPRIAEQWEHLLRQRTQQRGGSVHTGDKRDTKDTTSSRGEDSTSFFSQYVLDEMGMSFRLCIDGRSKNGQ